MRTETNTGERLASQHKTVLPSGETSYVVRWRDPSTERQRARRFKRFAEARKFRTQIEASINTSSYADPSAGRLSVAELLEHHLRTAAFSKGWESCCETWSRLYIVPALGGRRISSLTTADVRELLADLRDDGVGESTVQHVYQLLRAALNVAVQEDRIPKNPAARISMPKVQRREPFFLTADQVAVLAQEMPERHQVMVRFVAYTGLRMGEATSLRVRNLDLMRMNVRVIEGGSTQGATKSRKVRVVPIPKVLVEPLASHLERFSRPADPDAFVFPGDQGGQLNGANWRRRILYPAAGRAGVLRDGEPVQPHDLRHTAASLWAASGYEIHEVSRMLGHSSITVTVDLYIHLFPSEQTVKASRFDQMLRDAEPSSGDVVAFTPPEGEPSTSAPPRG